MNALTYEMKRSLRELDLVGNELARIPAELGMLTKLERLDLQNNYLTALPPFPNLRLSLKHLDLRSNRLTQEQLRSLKVACAATERTCKF